MAVRKPKPMVEKPPPHTDETGSSERRQQPPRERPRPPEPFEECGPTGGYGGAGTDDEAKNDD